MTHIEHPINDQKFAIFNDKKIMFPILDRAMIRDSLKESDLPNQW